MALALAALTALLWFGHRRLAEFPQWLARESLSRRNPSAALEWLELAEWLHPADPETDFLKARAYRKQGRLDLVRRYIERAWDNGFPVERLRREQILSMAQAGQLRSVEPQLAGLLLDPQGDGVEICEAFVNGYLLSFRLNDALRLLETWSADYPRDPLPHLLSGKVYVQLSDFGPAEQALREALRLAPDHHEAAYEMGELLLKLKRPEEARAYFGRAGASSTLHAKARAREAHCLRVTGRSAEARKVLEGIVTGTEPPREALVELGRLHLDARNYTKALEVLERAGEQYSRDAEVRYALAEALRGAGRAEAARPHFAWSQTARAELARAYDLAEQVRKRPNDVDLRLEIGRIQLEYGSPTDGVKWLQSALNLEPRHTQAHELLAAYYKDRATREPEFAELARRHQASANGGAQE